jgi:2-oxoisovalerate ferredoxin oxidoreductase beta subunit
MSGASTAAAFFKHFDRHANGKGLKGSTTHYCPGCGHGLAHKYLAECIAELGIQDRTIVISPVGCAVFLYYYMDVGNTQAAHGRAPAVALGHKTANPEAIVVSYQGDGDLASIGLAEIVHAAQLGMPISVVFVNNAIYGMTGGQMAPTTLPGQISSTTPEGRGAFQGPPLKVAEMIAGLDGPVYVERTALFDQKSRNRTKRAIRKILDLQIQGTGFSFVEVLAECPTHLKLSPLQAEAWVRDVMVPTYRRALKNVEREAAFRWGRRCSTSSACPLPASTESRRASRKFPAHLRGGRFLEARRAGGDALKTPAMVLAIGGRRGLRRHAHPELRPGVAQPDVYADVRSALGASPASPGRTRSSPSTRRVSRVWPDRRRGGWSCTTPASFPKCRSSRRA